MSLQDVGGEKNESRSCHFRMWVVRRTIVDHDTAGCEWLGERE